MPRGKTHSDAEKAAVMAALLAGQGVGEVAAQYKLDKRLVSQWKKKIPDDALRQLAIKKEIDFSSLLSTYLEEALITLAVQAQHFRDKAWLNKQTAAELGTNHGILCDKAIRLLEAAERANESEPI